MNKNRVNELVSEMRSFGKEKYQKSELLPEMFALEQEIVNQAFKGECASTTKLKIGDVEKLLEQRNRDCGNVADLELQKFKEGSKKLSNLIKAEISGNRGEFKAFSTLHFIRSQNIVLKNVELGDGDIKTELDAIVITPGTITIVEVKNTAKDIFIDENGDYFRTGEFLKWDCNISEKMTLKEEMLRKALVTGGITSFQIRSVVVFTNNRIEVRNKYSRIRTCFVSQLAYVIDGFKSEFHFTEEEMANIESVIRTAESKVSYPFELDVLQYKNDFAILMVVLEDAAARKEEVKCEKEKTIKNKFVFGKFLKHAFVSKYARNAVATSALTMVLTVAVSAIRKGGFK